MSKRQICRGLVSAGCLIMVFLSGIPLSEASLDNDREAYVIESLRSYLSPNSQVGERIMAVSNPVPTRDITHLLLEARNNYHLYSNESQEFLNALFRRPDSTEYEEAGYLPSPVSTFEPDAAQYPNIGGKFKFWYVTHATPDNQGTVHTATLEFVQKMARAFENVYETEITAMGYPEPPYDTGMEDNGGDGKFDIYLMNCGENFYGYVVPDDWASDAVTGPDANAVYSFMVMDNDYSEFVDISGSEENAMKVTAAHEYHHVIQFGINAEAPGWYMEVTSTWMEDQVYDDINDNLQYVSDFFASPETALDEGDPHWYSAWIFNEFLETKYDQDVVRQVWDSMDDYGNDNAVDAISAVLVSNSATFKDAFTQFVAKNYAKTGFYTDAANAAYTDVAIANSESVHQLGDTVTSIPQQTVDVSHLSSKYYKFVPQTGISQSGLLTITVDGQDNKELNAVAVARKADGSYEEKFFDLDGASNQGSVNFAGFDDDRLSEVVLGLANYSQTSDNLEFTYEATLSSTPETINITGLQLNSTLDINPQDSVVLTASAANPEQADVYYKFFYRANYGTPFYESTDWTMVQEYSTSPTCTYVFDEAGAYVLVVRAVTDSGNEPAALPIMGQVVSVGLSNAVNISSLTSSAQGNIRAGVPVTFTAQASTSDESVVYYKFYYCANYGTSEYETTQWTMVQEYSTSTDCSITFPDAGKYVVVVRAVIDPDNEPDNFPITGLVVDAQ